jgi:hypothetical protein
MRPSNTIVQALDLVGEPGASTGDGVVGRPRVMCRDSLASARYGGDVELLRAIRDEEALNRQLQRTEVLRQKTRIRARLLSNAVRVNARLIPNVARSLDRVAAVLSTDKPLEAYVFAEPLVQAFVSEASSRYLVALSSGAVNMLGAEELEFVIGHELGHAAFGHLEVAAEAAIELESVSLEHCKLLLAWQRAAEISADRVGLLCCDSLEIAASALFKSICGLDLPDVAIDPVEFAQQWDGLAEEMLEHGVRDYWKLSHPLPPMRMQALLLFWSGRGQRDIDRSVARLLAHMDTPGGVSADKRDPLLSRFSFWGSLYVALADRRLDDEMLHELGDLAPPGFDAGELLRGAGSSRSSPDALEVCLASFREAKRTRRQKLSSKELHSLMSQLVDVAARRGRLSERGIEHVTSLGRELGIGAGAVGLIINKRMDKE